MKPSHLPIAICLILLFGSQFLSSQSLLIKGKFLDKELMATSANYTLVCEKIITVTGRGDGIESELNLNKNYQLIVGLDFNVTQTIFFSTATSLSSEFNFDFELILNENNLGNNKTEKKLFVCFNPKKNSFDYNRVMISRK